MRKRTIKEQGSGRQKMAIPFKLLKIVVGREARNWKGDSKARKGEKISY